MAHCAEISFRIRKTPTGPYLPQRVIIADDPDDHRLYAAAVALVANFRPISIDIDPAETFTVHRFTGCQG